MGCPLSQVVLAFEENEEFVQVDTSSDGPTAFCSRLPEKAGSGRWDLGSDLSYTVSRIASR